MKLRITHCDLDSTSTVVDRVFGIEFDKINYTNYGDESELLFLDELDENSEVWYTDFSPNKDAQKIIAESGAKCFIFDHHESVKDSIDNWMKEYPNVKYYFDNDKSGTKIYYDEIKKDYEFNSCLDEYVNLVSTYDLFDKENPYWEKAEKLNRCFFKSLCYYKDGVEKIETYIKSQVYKCKNYEHFEFTTWELEKIQKDINEENELFNNIITNKECMKTRKDEYGNYFVVVKLKKKISAIANRLLEKYKKLQYVIVINEYFDDDWKVSLRSRKGFNLLDFEYCSGHEEACGITSDECDVNDTAHAIWEGKKYSLNKRIIEKNT